MLENEEELRKSPQGHPVFQQQQQQHLEHLLIQTTPGQISSFIQITSIGAICQQVWSSFTFTVPRLTRWHPVGLQQLHVYCAKAYELASSRFAVASRLLCQGLRADIQQQVSIGTPKVSLLTDSLMEQQTSKRTELHGRRLYFSHTDAFPYSCL